VNFFSPIKVVVNGWLLKKHHMNTTSHVDSLMMAHDDGRVDARFATCQTLVQPFNEKGEGSSFLTSQVAKDLVSSARY
jgi:hypothetical protein